VAESNLAALLDALRAQVMDAVLFSQAQAMLAQTGAALEELERADREVLEIAAGAHDVDDRIAATQRELKALRHRPPQPRLRERLGEAQREVTRDFRDGLDELGDRMLDRVDRDWGRELAAAIPEEIQNEVDALWGAAANALDRRASETAGALFAEYGLGTIDVAAHAGQVRALADLDGSIPPPPKPRSTVHRTLMRISRIGGAVGLWLWGMPLLIPAAAVGLLLYEERRERHIGEQGEAKKFVGRRITAARKAFDRAFDQRIAGLRTSLLGELEPRYQARLESVEAAVRSLTELKRTAASADAVRARLAELEPLWQRQTDLQTRLTGKEQS
jgi:hypothetical protein